MVMENGKAEQLDTPHNIYHHPASDYVRSFVVEQMERKYQALVSYRGGSAE